MKGIYYETIDHPDSGDPFVTRYLFIPGKVDITIGLKHGEFAKEYDWLRGINTNQEYLEERKKLVESLKKCENNFISVDVPKELIEDLISTKRAYEKVREILGKEAGEKINPLERLVKKQVNSSSISK